MERGHIKIRIWLLALHLMSASKKGISAHQLHRMLGVTYKTAWFMAHRIRYAMQQEPLAGMLKGEIEADETYVGARKLRYPGVGAYQKKAVALLVERGGRAHAMPVNEVTTKTLREELFHLADRDSTLFTDELPVYVRIGREFRGGHHRSLHKHREYVRRTPNGEVLVTTNTAESFFSLLKRAHVGTFHQLSKKHLHRYTTEFSFRWNHRKATDGQRMVAAIKGAEWQRLMYREPVPIFATLYAPPTSGLSHSDARTYRGLVGSRHSPLLPVVESADRDKSGTSTGPEIPPSADGFW
jgi:transposase-like protein